MKITKLTLIGIIFLLLTSCAQEVKNNCTLTKLYDHGNLVQEFFYINDVLARIEQYDNVTGSLVIVHTIVRDNVGRIDFDHVYYPDGTLYFSRKFNYNANGKVGWVYLMTDTNADGIPDSITGSLECVYNSSKEITELKYYNASYVYTNSDYYIWTNGNITRIDSGPGTAYQLITYDDKPAKYGWAQTDVFSAFLYPITLSKNNQTSVAYYSAVGTMLSTNNYTYSYNGDGYPETESVSSSSYEYTCKPE